MAPLTRFLTKIESSKKSKACLEMPKRRKKLSKKRVVVGVYSACSEFQHLKPQMHQGCLVILWNTSLNLSFHWNWFGWGTEVFHQSSKVPHLWVLAQIFTISVVFLIEKSVCKGADLRLWIPVAGVFLWKKRPKPTEETENFTWFVWLFFGNLRCRSHGEKTGRAEDELGGSLVMEPALRVGDVDFP